MKMKLMVAAAVAALCLMVGVLAGCATTGGAGANGSTALTPAQVVQVACPSLETALTVVQETFAANPSDPNAVKIAADLAKAAPVVAQVCAVGATIDATSVASLANTALPALSELAGYVPITAAQLQQVRTGLMVAQVALNVANVVETNIQAAQAAKAVPATAPTGS